MKRKIALLLVAIMVVSVMPINVRATQPSFDYWTGVHDWGTRSRLVWHTASGLLVARPSVVDLFSTNIANIYDAAGLGGRVSSADFIQASSGMLVNMLVSSTIFQYQPDTMNHAQVRLTLEHAHWLAHHLPFSITSSTTTPGALLEELLDEDVSISIETLLTPIELYNILVETDADIAAVALATTITDANFVSDFDANRVAVYGSVTNGSQTMMAWITTEPGSSGRQNAMLNVVRSGDWSAGYLTTTNPLMLHLPIEYITRPIVPEPMRSPVRSINFSPVGGFAPIGSIHNVIYSTSLSSSWSSPNFSITRPGAIERLYANRIATISEGIRIQEVGDWGFAAFNTTEYINNLLVRLELITPGFYWSADVPVVVYQEGANLHTQRATAGIAPPLDTWRAGNDVMYVVLDVNNSPSRTNYNAWFQLNNLRVQSGSYAQIGDVEVSVSLHQAWKSLADSWVWTDSDDDSKRFFGGRNTTTLAAVRFEERPPTVQQPPTPSPIPQPSNGDSDESDSGTTTVVTGGTPGQAGQQRPTINIPINEGAASIPVTQSGERVALGLRPGTNLDPFLAGTEPGDTITFDLSGISNAATAAVHQTALRQLADAQRSVEFILPSGSITLDPAAILEAVRGAQGSYFLITVTEADSAALTPNQAAALQGGEQLLRVAMHTAPGPNAVNNVRAVSNFGNGEITVTTPHTGAFPAQVWHMDAQGKRSELPTACDEAEQTVTFTTSRLSVFVIGQAPIPAPVAVQAVEPVSVPLAPVTLSEAENHMTRDGELLLAPVFRLIPNPSNPRYVTSYAMVRVVADILGLDWSWDEAARSAMFSDGDTTVIFTHESGYAVVNGAAKAITASGLPADARIVAGRFFVPLAFFGEVFPVSVQWDGDARSVTVIPR